MSPQALPPLIILLSSLIPALLILCLGEERVRLRNTLNLGGAVLKVVVVALVLWGVYRGMRFELAWQMLPGLRFVLRVDALAMLFVTLSALLWLLTTVYAIGYLAGRPNNRRFFGFFCLCVASTVGIALAGNLFTLFIFYELLTLSTYPLVAHWGDRRSQRAGRVYLIHTLCGGVLVLIGAVWLQVLAGPVEFSERGGALDHVDAARHGTALMAIFGFLVVGFGVKAALVPLHRWLPAAMVAPAPVSALLHAVAVVKAGAFGIIRVIYDLYGAALAHALGVTFWLVLAAAATILYGSWRALHQLDLKRRLAYSTVSQVSYILLGTALFGPLATVGAMVHLVHQGIMKITMFFCAGSYAETLGIHRIDELDGAGRVMPWTSLAFTTACLGMIGLPPMAGFISKWYLGLGALQGGQGWAMPVLIVSSLLNAAYFLPLVYRLWFKPQPARWPHAVESSTRLETRPSLLWPPLVTAALTLVFGLLAGSSLSPLYWAGYIARLEYGP